MGSWKRTPLLRERGYLWVKSKMVSGGWIVSDSNLTDDITIDIENLFKDYSCEYISKLPPKKYGDGFTQEKIVLNIWFVKKVQLFIKKHLKWLIRLT